MFIDLFNKRQLALKILFVCFGNKILREKIFLTN